MLGGHTDKVIAIAFSRDGRLVATASEDSTFKLWDSSTGEELANLYGHEEALTAISFSPDTKYVATASHDNTVKLWDADTGQKLRTLRGHMQGIQSIAFSPDGMRLLTTSVASGKQVTLWDPATGQELVGLLGHIGKVTATSFSADGKYVLTGCEDKTARLWDAASGRLLLQLIGHTGTIRKAIFSANGRMVLTSAALPDPTAKLWDAQTGQLMATLQGHFYGVEDATFSPDGKHVATASIDKTARVWDAATGKELCVLRGHNGGLKSVEFSPDGSRLLTCSDDDTAKLWDASSARELITLRGGVCGILSVAFSPDGTQVIAVSRDGRGVVWHGKAAARRCLEQREMSSARSKAEPIVIALHRQSGTWSRVAEGIRKDASLDALVRHEALKGVLRLSSAELYMGARRQGQLLAKLPPNGTAAGETRTPPAGERQKPSIPSKKLLDQYALSDLLTLSPACADTILQDTVTSAPASSFTTMFNSASQPASRPKDNRTVRLLLASEMLNRRVHDSRRNTPVIIDELVLDLSCKRLAYAVTKRDTQWEWPKEGTQERWAVPFSALASGFAADIIPSISGVLDSPSFNVMSWPNMNDLDWKRKTHAFYNQVPYWGRGLWDKDQAKEAESGVTHGNVPWIIERSTSVFGHSVAHDPSGKVIGTLKDICVDYHTGWTALVIVELNELHLREVHDIDNIDNGKYLCLPVVLFRFHRDVGQHRPYEVRYDVSGSRLARFSEGELRAFLENERSAYRIYSMLECQRYWERN